MQNMDLKLGLEYCAYNYFLRLKLIFLWMVKSGNNENNFLPLV